MVVANIFLAWLVGTSLRGQLSTWSMDLCSMLCGCGGGKFVGVHIAGPWILAFGWVNMVRWGRVGGVVGIGSVVIICGVFGAGHWGIVLWSFKTFLIFSNFLRSKLLSSSATREATCVYYVYQ